MEGKKSIFLYKLVPRFKTIYTPGAGAAPVAPLGAAAGAATAPPAGTEANFERPAKTKVAFRQSSNQLKINAISGAGGTCVCCDFDMYLKKKKKTPFSALFILKQL